MPTVIVKCTCESKFQDEQHGYKMRVANTMKENDRARCTVCGKEINVFHGKGTS